MDDLQFAIFTGILLCVFVMILKTYNIAYKILRQKRYEADVSTIWDTLTKLELKIKILTNYEEEKAAKKSRRQTRTEKK